MGKFYLSGEVGRRTGNSISNCYPHIDLATALRRGLQLEAENDRLRIKDIESQHKMAVLARLSGKSEAEVRLSLTLSLSLSLSLYLSLFLTLSLSWSRFTWKTI